jgi:hypothetical protein
MRGANDVLAFLHRLLDAIERFLRRILGRDVDPAPGPAPATPVLHFSVEVDAMKNALFTFTLPTTRQAGGALDPAAIVATEIALRVVGIEEWTVLGMAEGTATEFAQDELDFGDYEARAVVITDGDVRGIAAVLPFAVSDDSRAAAVEGLAVELS